MAYSARSLTPLAHELPMTIVAAPGLPFSSVSRERGVEVNQRFREFCLVTGKEDCRIYFIMASLVRDFLAGLFSRISPMTIYVTRKNEIGNRGKIMFCS
jgi:hypothetical protein